MINSKEQLCIARIAKIYSGLSLPLKQQETQDVEIHLDIVLPLVFKNLCNIYRYDYIGHFEFCNFRLDKEFSVISKTKSWRDSINLPHNYLVLADDGTSAILMKIDGDNASIIWCALEDVLNICNNIPMEYDPTIFPTFTDFYEFLLDEEEKTRAEEELKDKS